MKPEYASLQAQKPLLHPFLIQPTSVYNFKTHLTNIKIYNLQTIHGFHKWCNWSRFSNERFACTLYFVMCATPATQLNCDVPTLSRILRHLISDEILFRQLSYWMWRHRTDAPNLHLSYHDWFFMVFPVPYRQMPRYLSYFLPNNRMPIKIKGFPIYSLWYTSYSVGINLWYNQRPYSPTEIHTIVPHRHLPCIKMPQHNLAENVNQYFILKFINTQNVEVVHKSWGNNVSTLADNTHGTYQLHNKTCFDYHIWGRLCRLSISQKCN